MGYQDKKAMAMPKYFSSNKDGYPSGGIPIRTNFSTGTNKKMKEHSKHHSAKHMSAMKKDIKKGSSFTKAHTKAIKKVGV